MTRRRASAMALLVAGLAALAVSLTSEFVGGQWWSSVNLTRLEQRYIVFLRGQVMVGRRGTAGFFNRGIPAAGLSLHEQPQPLRDPWYRRLFPRGYSLNQNSGVAMPVYPLAALALGLGMWLRVRRPAPGRCAACGYDLTGLKDGPCPECGTLPRA